MAYTISKSHNCTCPNPHRDGEFVVRFVHANGRPWTCRMCPHFSTYADAIARTERMESFAQHHPQFSNLRSA